MRIVHITKFLPGYAGGIEQVTDSLARFGDEAGHQISVCGMRSESTGPMPRRRGIHLIPLRSWGTFFGFPVVPGYFALSKHLDSADVVHLHMPNPLAEAGLLLYYLRRRHRATPVLIPVYHAPILRLSLLGRGWQRWVHPALFTLASQILVSSAQLVSRVRQLGIAFPPEKAAVVPFGMDGPPSRPPSVSASGTVRLITISRLVDYKGLELLLRALNRVTGKWTLDLVGSGPKYSTLRDLAATLNLADRIHFHGTVDDATKRGLLNRSDVYLLPSQTDAESFGLSLVEAFSYGKSAVVCRIPTGVSYLARNGSCGAVAEPGSEKSLATAIQGLLDDAEWRQAAGQANRIFWEEHLTSQLFRDGYQEAVVRAAQAYRPSAQSLSLRRAAVSP